MLPKYTLLGIYLVLALISLTILKSIAPSLAVIQLIFFILGGGLLLLLSWVKFEFVQRLAAPLYAGLNFLLALTLTIGQVTKGSARWIDVGSFFHIQPSQLAVPIVLLLLPTLIHSTKPLTNLGLLRVLLMLGVPAGLILIEPDLGTTLIFLACAGSALWLAPIQLKQIMGLAASSLLIAVLAWLLLLKPYQKDRIYSFLDSSNHPQASYNSQQAMIAVGSGQIWGRGLGQGVQSHLRFLPERQTDFVYASLAEEVGLIGSLVVVGLYFILFFQLWLIGYQAEDLAKKQYVYGILMLFLSQTFINIGMNIGLIPITGVTLPFISYGGSSILSLAMALGLVQSIATHRPQKSTLIIN